MENKINIAREQLERKNYNEMMISLGVMCEQITRRLLVEGGYDSKDVNQLATNAGVVELGKMNETLRNIFKDKKNEKKKELRERIGGFVSDEWIEFFFSVQHMRNRSAHAKKNNEPLAKIKDFEARYFYEKMYQIYEVFIDNFPDAKILGNVIQDITDKFADKTVYISCNKDGKYISYLEESDPYTLYGNAGVPSSWEFFRVTLSEDGCAFFQADNGLHVRISDPEDPYPVLLANSENKDSWEKFKIYKLTEGEYFIRSIVNRKWVQRNEVDENKIMACSPKAEINGWESFNIVAVY